jgi:uncharacterized membrane protein
VLDLLVTMMDQTLHLLPPAWRTEGWLGIHVPGMGVLLTLLVVFGTGVFAANIIGQKLLTYWEGLLARIPVVNSLYSGVKQVSDTLFSGNGHAFRKVLLVRYPHPQSWSLAFQTNVPAEVGEQLPGDYVGVFIPTTPSPVNGFYFYVKREDVIETDLTVETALKYIVSMGVVTSGAARRPDLVRPLPQRAANQ